MTNLFEEQFKYAAHRQELLHILKIFQMHAAIYATICHKLFLGRSHLITTGTIHVDVWLVQTNEIQC